MVQEIKDLGGQIAKLEKELVSSRELIKLLKAEVAWAERGYTASRGEAS